MSKVLVIDDDPDVVTLTSDLLLSLGLGAISAHSFEEALDRWDEFRDEVSLVLLDLTLGDRTGDELAEQFLRDKPDLPIIFMTGLDLQSANLSEALRARVKLLPKPFTLAEFRAVVRPKDD